MRLPKKLRPYLFNTSDKLGLVSLKHPSEAVWPLRLTQLFGGRKWSLALVVYETSRPMLTEPLEGTAWAIKELMHDAMLAETEADKDTRMRRGVEVIKRIDDLLSGRWDEYPLTRSQTKELEALKARIGWSIFGVKLQTPVRTKKKEATRRG